MDVDVGGTPEPEDETARDEEGVEIVQQLERGLPRWQGLGEQGWTWEAPPEKWVDVVLAIKGHKDAVYVFIPVWSRAFTNTHCAAATGLLRR